jgi:hypothetical protein
LSNVCGGGQLYNHFSVQYDLPECTLLLMHAGGDQRADAAIQLWAQVLARTWNDAAAVAARAAELGRRLAGNASVFPVLEVAAMLERLKDAHRHDNVPADWAVQTLAAAGLRWADLLALYRQLATKVRRPPQCCCWRRCVCVRARGPMHMLCVAWICVGLTRCLSVYLWQAEWQGEPGFSLWAASLHAIVEQLLASVARTGVQRYHHVDPFLLLSPRPPALAPRNTHTHTHATTTAAATQPPRTRR